MTERRFTPDATLIKERDDDTPRQLDTSKAATLYIRRSTLGQEDNDASLILQDEKMEARLRRKGFTEIIKIAIDDLHSAQLVDREGIADIEKLVKSGTVSAVAAHDASRIWRDRTHVYDNKFIELLAKYRVSVIFHNATYWPRDKTEREKLQDAFKTAAQGLNQFDFYANPARVAIAELGRYAGHAIPIGFIVVGTKKNKHYAIYEPHARLVRWLFKRYKELNGNLGRLGQELVSKDFHFPDFDDTVRDVPHIALKHDDKGYACQSRTALISILTNVAYLGWYAFSWEDEETGKKVTKITSKSAHDAIIEDMSLFRFAYDRLSKYTLDGERNENKPEIERHYSKVNALLEGLVTSRGATVYAMGDGNYTARRDNDSWQSSALAVRIADIDAVVSEALIQTMFMIERYPVKLAEFKQQLETLQQEAVASVDSYESDLEAIDKGIKGWELQRAICRREADEAGITEATRALKGLYADRARLEDEHKQVSNERDVLVEYCTLVGEVTHMWQSWPFHKRQRFVKIVVDSATIEEVTPHIILLTLNLGVPINLTLAYHIYRKAGIKEPWTDKENAILQRHYPNADRGLIMEKLPTRTWGAILLQSTNVLHLLRRTRANTSGIPDGACLADIEYMRSLGWADKAAVFPLNKQLTPEHILVLIKSDL